MADEIKNATEEQGDDVSITIPEKPKRKRTVKKAEPAISSNTDAEETAASEVNENSEQTPPPAVKSKPRKKAQADATEDADASTQNPKTTAKRKPKTEQKPVDDAVAAKDSPEAQATTSANDATDKKTDEETAIGVIAEILNSEPQLDVYSGDTFESASNAKTSEDASEEDTNPLPPLMNIEHFFDYRPVSVQNEEDEAQAKEAEDETIDSAEENAIFESAQQDTDELAPEAEIPVIQEYENYTILDEIEEQAQEKEVRAKALKTRDNAKYDSDKPRAVDKKFDMIELFVFTLVIIMLLTTFVFKHSIVEGGSMQNTLQPGDHLIISDLFYKPKQYDLIVFQDVNLKCGAITYNDPIVKRIIATEGQVVEVINMETIYVDGVLVPREYALVDGPESEYRENMYPFTTTVPEGEVFVMGDHRNASDDSRYFGTIKEEAILGKVLFRIYPLSGFGIIKPQDSKD